MRIATRIADLRPGGTRPIALVPTMGAFHEGHLSLIRSARVEDGTVVVSLFVNPTQFGPGDDFSRYPRDFDRDSALASAAGADVLFAPSVDEMFPRPSARIVVPEVTEEYEGRYRPGHFDGVATVVAKLFHIVGPEVAYFGRKDLQQCAVVRRMVEDLNMPVRLVFAPTVREPDGLAMSSRNAYLSQVEREIAPELYRRLQRAREELTANESPRFPGADAVSPEHRRALEDAGFRVEYFDLANTRTMRRAAQGDRDTALVAAAWLGRTRLIDNVPM